MIIKYSAATFFLIAMLCLPAYAHDGGHGTPTAHAMEAATLSINNQVSITTENGKRVIRSNGIPDHTVGAFPNKGNPNRISAQNHVYSVSTNPQKLSQPRPHQGVIGVALNGVPIEPGTAECYGQARGQRPTPGQSCDWKEEAIVQGRGLLGLDMNNAHVQPNGSYHYHGIPHGFLNNASGRDIVHIGYAADGFPMMASRSGRYKPSYALKSGTRPSGPGGRYDGTYTADFKYAQGTGDLDQCNGLTLSDGSYAYFITKEFPFAPRCLFGKADQSFIRRGLTSGTGENSNFRRPPPWMR